jgi:small basic protein
MILLPLLALLLGFVMVYVLKVSVPIAYSDYVAVAILAGLDSVVGGVRGVLDHRFEPVVFVTGFFMNAAVAALLVFAGDRLGVNMYLPAVVALGVRIFYNLGHIRHQLLDRMMHRTLEHPPESPESFAAPPSP